MRGKLLLLCFATGIGCDLFPETPPLSQLEAGTDAVASAGMGGSAGAGGAMAGGSGGVAGQDAGQDAGAAGSAGNASAAGSSVVEVTLAVTTGGDDVNEDGSNLVTNGSTLWLGTGEDPEKSFAGLRFTQVPLPKGAKVLEAKLEVVDTEGQWMPLDLRIAGEASSDCKGFKKPEPPSKRLLTEAVVQHSSNEPWEPGEYTVVADVSAVVEEVVGLPGWSPGHALCLVLEGEGSAFGRKFVSSFEGGQAPRLLVRIAE
jgi:hypothetical protein